MIERTRIFLLLLFFPSVILGSTSNNSGPTCVRRPYLCTPKNEAIDCCGNRCVPLITPSVSQKTIYATLNFVGSSGESELDLTLIHVCSEDKIGTQPYGIRGDKTEKYLTAVPDASEHALGTKPGGGNSGQGFPDYEYPDYTDNNKNPFRFPPGPNSQFPSKWGSEYGGNEYGNGRRPVGGGAPANRISGGRNSYVSRACQTLQYKSDRFGDSCPVWA